MISAKVDLLCKLFDDHLNSRIPINLSDAYLAFANE